MRVNLFHIGAQKCATTWFYEAIKTHPEVQTSPKDSIHFFDINYHRGTDWYHSKFKSDGPALLDPTYSYIRSNAAAERIAQYNPDARIIFCARNPLKRAFSHYWHEKKKDKLSFSFSEVLVNYDLFDSWIVPGFYAQHWKRYAQLFGEEKVHVIVFDDIADDPVKVMSDVCSFCGLSKFEDTAPLLNKVNVASGFQSQFRRRWQPMINKTPIVRKVFRKVDKVRGEQKERLEDVDADVREQIIEIVRDDTEEFGRIIGRDVSHWLQV